MFQCMLSYAKVILSYQLNVIEAILSQPSLSQPSKLLIIIMILLLLLIILTIMIFIKLRIITITIIPILVILNSNA